MEIIKNSSVAIMCADRKQYPFIVVKAGVTMLVKIKPGSIPDLEITHFDINNSSNPISATQQEIRQAMHFIEHAAVDGVLYKVKGKVFRRIAGHHPLINSIEALL